jgi:hypothetical protein
MPPLMHFDPGWSGPNQDFVHGGYYTGDNRYGYVNHQQDRRASGQENRIVRNAKLDHLISLKTTAAPSHWHEREALKDGSSTNQLRSSQERTWPGSESSANGKAKPDAEKSPEEVAAE